MAKKTEHLVNFSPNPIQKQFIESRAKADLFSSRRGEGKSTALAWSIFYHTRHNPGADWILVRDTWENLQATTQKEFFKWFPPGIAGEYHATNKVFKWGSGLAEGTLSFLGMDDAKDAAKVMSREIAGMAIDEPSPAIGSAGVDELIFDMGYSSLRQPGMKWYSVKLAQNNPDESHWTYRKFVSPGTEGFRAWQPHSPENEANLPPTYYSDLRKVWAHRPDLVRRFVDGQYGFQSEGKAVTPQWSDQVHLALGLIPTPRRELYLLWDFGHNPTCIITQLSPLGHWLILESYVGEGIGTEELILDVIRPTLTMNYRNCPLTHIGDPTGKTADQSSMHRSPVRVIKKELGGVWKDGPVRPEERIEPLRAVLSRIVHGRGVVQVDRHKAQEVWWALRGGWNFHVARTGIISALPKKDIHSHPGDAMSYGAAVLFPMGRLTRRESGLLVPETPGTYFRGNNFRIGPQPSTPPPAHGSRLGE